MIFSINNGIIHTNGWRDKMFGVIVGAIIIWCIGDMLESIGKKKWQNNRFMYVLAGFVKIQILFYVTDKNICSIIWIEWGK